MIYLYTAAAFSRRSIILRCADIVIMGILRACCRACREKQKTRVWVGGEMITDLYCDALLHASEGIV